MTKNLPPSPPTSPESPSCVLHKMSLSKGATFHCSSSPPTEDDPVLSIPHLARRSPTCSQSTLASWLSDKKDVVQSLVDFEQTFSGARGKRLYPSGRGPLSSEDWDLPSLPVRRVLLPSNDEGLGSSISPSSEKGLAHSLERVLDLVSDKDSGVGTSVGDSADPTGDRVGETSEEDGLVRDLIQGWLARCVMMCEVDVDQPLADADSPDPASRRRRRQSPSSSRSSNTITPSAVTQSIAPPPAKPAARHPPLSSFARKTIKEHIIGPILREERFGDLHHLVSSLGSRSNKAIRCLRDLEQNLIFRPLVSALILECCGESDLVDKTLAAISRQLYRVFGEFTIQLVVDTYHHLSESEQRRVSDRPYDNGYFLDLVQQVGRLASQIGSSNPPRQAGPADGEREVKEEDDEDDDMAYSADDEVTLEGGLGSTGDFAELVRWKNGRGISLRTGKIYEPTVGIKRESTGALDEDVARSMARRKKGYIPEIVEMKCGDKSCNKVFTRKCDLAKHEKTHSRPFKCPEVDCKYHDLGLPTEKERDRHINDKHDPNPHFYKCQFCEFRTKRESNCKQHQEKKHNWHYERAKGKDKATRETPGQTPQTPNMDYTPSPAVSHRTWDDSSSVSGSVSAGSVQLTPFEQPIPSFDTYQQAGLTYSNPLFPRPTPQPIPYLQTADGFGFETGAYDLSPYQDAAAQAYISPTNTTPISPEMMRTPITPAYSNITGQSPYVTNMDITLDCTNPTTTFSTGLPTPGSFLQPHSRDPSISNRSPLLQEPSGQSFVDVSMMGQDMDFAASDFSLFGESHSAFSNPAAATATLFPGNAEAFAMHDNNSMFKDMVFDDDFVTFQGMDY